MVKIVENKKYGNVWENKIKEITNFLVWLFHEKNYWKVKDLIKFSTPYCIVSLMRKNVEINKKIKICLVFHNFSIDFERKTR